MLLMGIVSDYLPTKTLRELLRRSLISLTSVPKEDFLKLLLEMVFGNG